MDPRRIEPLPACLFAVAAAALGLSIALATTGRGVREAARAEPPRRSSEPLRWPLEAAPAPASPYVAKRADDPELRRFTISPPAPTPPEVIAEIATQPFAYRAPQREAVVLLVGPSQWRAGDGGRRVVSRSQRRRWSVGPIDTLAAAEWLGRATAAPVDSRVDFGRVVASLQQARRIVDRAAVSAQRSAPAPRPAKPVARVVAPSVIATIPAYLASGSQHGAFPAATKLAEQLGRVADDRAVAPWAWAVAYHLRTLAAAGVSEGAADRALSRLDDAIDEALTGADRRRDERVAAEWRRAAYAVRRRVDAWRAEQMQAVVAMRLGPTPGLAESQRRLESARWAMSKEGLGLAPGVVLAEPWAPLRVAQRLEQYEQRPTSGLASSLAAEKARLAASTSEHDREVAAAIEQNYRNANLRIAVAAELLERLLPEPAPVQAPVRDRIAGANVRGQSVTQTDIDLRLTPDPFAWRIGLEARGVVESHTQARGGPALLGSRTEVVFTAKKLIVVTPQGIRSAPAVADARTTGSRLVSVATDYDRIPLVGDYARSAARREYAERRPRAAVQTRMKVEQQARETLDNRVRTQLTELRSRYDEQLALRTSALGIRIEPIEMRTTPQRLVGRLRLANHTQLAAHTPRLRAPSDSLLSVQLHESTLNNTLAGLDLAGESLTPEELRERIEQRLGAAPREGSHEPGVVLRFAADDPVRVSLAEGRAHLVLSLDEINIRGHRHHDFRVHTYFRPEVDGLTAELVQEGTPQIEGRLRTSSRLHLHGVFGKVLGEGRRVPLVRVTHRTPEPLAAALTGLATNQLVIEDGWLGLAIGPPRAAGRVAVQVGGYVR
ncbi:hypothetical protein [Botrimarina sp.]|uniref:hypothetical protein n=1 Tax=Botrimarina sp. TaxID=2795802 RepID=UPI0032ED9919